MMLASLLLLPILHSLIQAAGLPAPCSHCRAPTFPPGNGRVLYLPHCVEDMTLNYCDAVCTGKKMNKGSCNSCEERCSMVFTPVCSSDQATLYPSQCQAECAGVDWV